MYKILHLVPYDDIGGVEVAAKTLQRVTTALFDFELVFLFSAFQPEASNHNINSPLRLFQKALDIHKRKPDVLIVSLWRSALVGIFLKLLRPKLHLVLFVHNERDAHYLDQIVTRVAAALAREIWFDSNASMVSRLPKMRAVNKRVISFMTERIEPAASESLVPHFLFWGRMTKQKNIVRAIHIFALFHEKVPDAKFVIIGPDGGQLTDAEFAVGSLGLSDAVSFAGAMEREDIFDHAKWGCFYLQTSEHEGMSMATVEAMQLGLLPVVTPVGEVANYCVHKKNALLISSDEEVVEELVALMNKKDNYYCLKAQAANYWKDKPTYRESVIGACSEIVA